MMSDALSEYRSGDLRIVPALGRVANGRGESVRLGPVNMNVLALLLSRPGEVIGRAELFETVWPNQVVSEDSLTRSVSDIRAQLRKLSGRDNWIETLPKRGYRWLGEASAADADEIADAVPAAREASFPTAGDGDRQGRSAERILRFVGRGFAYLLALVALASLIVFAMDRLATPGAPIVAVLPIAAGPEQAGLAAALDLALNSDLMTLDGIRVLSRSAVESRPPNPFPFFYYEFGASWLVESEIRTVAGHPVLTIDIVDARTGIVEMQFSGRIARDEPGAASLPAAVSETVERFVDAQLAR